MREAFCLDPSVVHLNHGSFGAVPRVVVEAQQRIRDRAEANPMRFFRVDSPALRADARHVAAGFLGVGADEVALVRNVTEAISTVLASLALQGRLGAGDVVVMGTQSYGAVRRAVARWCQRTGASYDVVDLPAAGEGVVDGYRAALARAVDSGSRVRLVVVDHISSPTGAVLPVAEVAADARAAGALTFVDAAHVPGHLPADPAATGADFWSGTWHKWGFAPRGTTGLWVAGPEREPARTADHELERRAALPAAVRHARHRRLLGLDVPAGRRRLLDRRGGSRDRGPVVRPAGQGVGRALLGAPGRGRAGARRPRPRACVSSRCRTAWPRRTRTPTGSTGGSVRVASRCR